MRIAGQVGQVDVGQKINFKVFVPLEIWKYGNLINKSEISVRSDYLGQLGSVSVYRRVQ